MNAKAVARSGRRAATGWAAPLLVALLLGAPGGATAQEATVTGSAVAISSLDGGRAELELRLADGAEHTLVFGDGAVRVDGETLGPYEPGGALEGAWRDFLREHAGAEPAALGPALLDWEPDETADEGEAAVGEALEAAIDRLLGVAAPAEPAETVNVTGPSGTQLAIAPGGLSFESLSRRLERLEGSLEDLGPAAEGADERLALIVHDDYAIEAGRTVAGNLALLGGTLGVEGTVAGDVLVLDGTLVLEPSAAVEGDVLQVGGTVEERGGRVAGELLSIRSTGRAVAEAPEAPAPTRPPRAVGHRDHRGPRGFVDSAGRYVGNAVGGLAGTMSALIGLGVLGLVGVYFARPQLEVVADTARYSFGRAFAMGLAGEVLFGPVLLILAVLVITWLVIPFFLIGVALALLGGYLAVGHALGEGFARRRYRYEWLERLRRSNSYYYVLSGLALLLAPFAIYALLWLLGGLGGFLRGLVCFAAVTVTWIAATTGFGAVLLTRGGTRKEYATAAPWRSGGDVASGKEGPGA